MNKQDYINKIKRQYPYIEYEDIEETYEIAKRELLIALYSCNTDIIQEDTPIPYAYEYTVLQAMKEIVDIGNMRNFTSYSENGWSWSRPDGGLVSYRNVKSKAGIY